MLVKIFAYISSGNSYVFCRPELNLQILYCFDGVMVCKIFFCSKFLDIPQLWRSKRIWRKLANNAKISLLRASMVVTYYIKLFHMGADRHNSILMSLLLLVAETVRVVKIQ